MFVKADPFLDFSRASLMKLFAKIVNSFQLFSQKASSDVCLGSRYASEKTETFKMKLRLAKSLRLLQRAVFLVICVNLFYILYYSSLE